MDEFKWTEDLMIGVKAIDEDHQSFFDICNNLIHIENKGEIDRLVIISYLNILNEYIEGHFLREEKAMKKSNYPHYAGHRHHHEVFKKRVEDLSKLYIDEKIDILQDLIHLITNWLISHIKIEDMKYRNWITESNIDSRHLYMID